MKILVTGGAGYIGSHAVRELLRSAHSVVVLDNLSNGHAEAVDPRVELVIGSTSDSSLLHRLLYDNQIEAVMHFAADIEVGESVIDPFKYYQNNFANSLKLLKAMVDAQVSKFIFSSTAAVYGNPVSTPIHEDQARHPINPYGRSKMMTEMAIEDFCVAHGMGYSILRYFNVAGASPDSTIGEDHSPESHLIPRILQAANGSDMEMKIFGTDYPTKDGTCIRDYVHVVDLVRAHVLAIEALSARKGKIYNVGSETGFSVREVIEACKRVTGRPIKVKEEARRPGDPAILVASSQKLRNELKWEPLYPSIETIVQHAWRWHTSHPHGYKTKLPPEQFLHAAL
ncbi:MAG TPA: UDP-glucose 4-epimerase GalE [Bacteriovoracaceae bacterium]|nr:UDP-glucose 4-epimerase GalE [Bacteriovoracaceae bacterium]